MGTLEQLLLEIASRFAPLADRIQNKEIVLLLNELGLPVPDSADEIQGFTDSIAQLNGNLLAVFATASSLKTAITENDIEKVVASSVEIAQNLKDLFEGIKLVSDSIQQDIGPAVMDISEAELEDFLSKLPKKLFDYVVVTNIEATSTPLADVLEFIKAIERTDVTNPGRPPFIDRQINFSALPDFLSNPGKHIENHYDWNKPEFDGAKLFKALSKILNNSGIPVIYDQTNAPSILNAIFLKLSVDNSRPVPGLLLEPRLDAKYPTEFTITEDAWEFGVSLDIKLSSGAQLSLFPDGSLAVNMPQFAGGKLAATLELGYADKPFDLLAIPGGSRLEATRIKSKLEVLIDSTGSGAIDFSAELNKIHLVIDFSKGDSFVKNIASSKVESEVDLKFGYATNSGFYIEGSGALEINLPSHIEIGPVEMLGLTIKLQPKDGAIPITVGCDIKATLGPIKASISDIGLKAIFSFPDNNSGNLGPLDLDLGFKPPTGIGLTIDGGGFKGGGFLKFDPEEERYTGFLELEFEGKIALKAIGLLETRLPNSQDGYTLLILITAEFTPVQLGFGFTLNGVGGLLGLNRMVDIERLRTGIRDNTLGSILFPQNIVENAERIISDLRQVFPTQEGRFVFGPMAKIGWGSPTILTLDLGLLIEVPNPVRFAILGVLKGILPKEDAPVLRLQVNFLGEINLQKKQLLFDASLYDSKLLAFALTGDMAVRLYWGEDPNFLLTVGGFHPAYQPPPMNLPDIRRITLALMEGDNPRIRLETYFAVTSNTVQFGAKAELYASAWKFNVSGFIAFDVLFQFSPFRFVAEVSAMLALSVGSSPFASIKLAFALEGPTPWSVKGTASFKICWFFTLNIRFNKTWGEGQNLSLPDVAVMPLLLAALNDNNNWTAELPRGRNLLVSTREVLPMAGSELKVIVQPFGILSVSQKVVPLNLAIQKFGNLRPADGNLFRITDVRIGEHTIVQSPEVLKEHFAPAQFFEKSDAEKLSDKSFERYDSGIRLKGSGQLKSAYAAARKVKYELKYIDSQTKQRLSNPDIDLYQSDPGAFNTWAMQGTVSKSELSHARNRKPALAPGAVSLEQERYGVVDVGDLSLINNGSLLASEAEAKASLDSLVDAKPELRGRLQVMPVFELA